MPWLFSNAWKRCLRAGCVVLLCGPVIAEQPVAVWDSSVLIDGGLGYRDNVLRSSVETEDSGFFQTTADASLMRLSETDSLLMIYLFGDDIRYFDAPSVNYEQVLSGTVQWNQPVGEKNKAGLRASYLYQHQVFDASATEVLVSRTLVLGHSAMLRPSWEYLFNDKWSATLEGVGELQFYEHELDDFWEGGAEFSLERTYGHRSMAGLIFSAMHRDYDTREQYDRDGFPEAGTDLTYLQTEGGVRWSHYWDADRRWRTSSRINYLLNRDNGSGYFDYDRFQFRHQLRWRGDRWSAKTNFRYAYYKHKLQEIDGDRRYRSNVSLDCRVEREIGKHWRLYANVEYEWSDSNDPRDDYESWMAGTGAGVEF